MKSYWLALGLMMLTNEPLELRMWTLVQMQVINAFNPFLKYCELAVTDIEMVWVLKFMSDKFTTRTRSLSRGFLNPTFVFHNF
jgi:hypothetical protein